MSAEVTLSPSEPVRAALSDGRPIVALETSVLAQGLPPPRNIEVAAAMSAAVRGGGAEPAWIFLDRGRIRLGASEEDLLRLCTDRSAVKVARRDLPIVLAGGALGATTVSATLWSAARAGIQIAVTGGIGGVHPGSGDVSADLFELARTPGLLVCSGPKSIVDPTATLERLEELGVVVVGYRCERLPFFVVREADIPLEHQAQSPAELAAMEAARSRLGLESTLLVCNPVPEDRAMPLEEVEAALRACTERAKREGISGKAATPYLLSCLAERTAGATLGANVALLASNAGLAAEVAAALVA